MALNEAMKEAMRNAMAEDNPPRRGRSNQTTLRLTKNPGKSSHVLLARADGTLTKAGEFHYAENPPQPTPTRQFDYNTPLVKRGANDDIRKRDGREALVRSLKVDGSLGLDVHISNESKQNMSCKSQWSSPAQTNEETLSTDKHFYQQIYLA